MMTHMMTHFIEAIWADVEDAKRELEKEEFLSFYQNDIFINPNNNS